MFLNSKTLLVIAAHPDDEVLGCGGTMARAADAGAQVHVLFLADGIGARHANKEAESPEELAREASAREACAILGANPPMFGQFPDNAMDTVSRLEVTKTIEETIARLAPDTILTHHAGDVNIDHRRIHEAVITACRPQPGHPVQTIAFFEVASSTEWQAAHSLPAFVPNVFVDISTTLERKEAALESYAQEMRAWPHARSIRALSHLARWRGATVGVEAAEAFILGRHIQRTTKD